MFANCILIGLVVHEVLNKKLDPCGIVRVTIYRMIHLKAHKP